MNSMERVSATLKGQEKDRCAVSLTLSLYGARLTQCPLETYYSDPKAYAAAQNIVREKCNPDILFGPFALTLEGLAFGSKLRFFDKNPPNLKQPILESTADISKLELPDPDSNPVLHFLFETIRLMKQTHKNDIPIAAVSLTPVDLPIMLLGIHGWLETVLFSIPLAIQLMELLAEYSIQKINRLFEAGASFVVLPCAFANPSIITHEIIRDIMIPVLQRLFQEIHGPLIIHSAGARLLPFLDLYHDLANVTGFVVNADEDMILARNKIKSDQVLIGNIEGPDLVMQSPEDVLRHCQMLLNTCKEDPHFILGTTGADIAYDTPLECILAFSKASEAYFQGE